MEEVGMPEAVADIVVDKCGEVAKIVAGEQEAKKAADARAKAQAGSNPFAMPFGGSAPAAAPVAAPAEEAAAEATDGEGHMPGPMEAAEGGSPEVIVHEELSESANDGETLSPEEMAVVDVEEVQGGEPGDEDTDVAALAEGRLAPPETHEDANRA